MAELKQQLIWLGAGSASQPALNFSEYHQVVLIDAREEATQALTKQFSAANAANVVVRTALIHPQSGSYNLQRYNLPEFAAITPVSGLKTLFPGLKVTSSETLQAQSLQQLLTELAFTGEQHTLVLDLADLAYELVQMLIQHKQLGLFNTIIVQYGATELYSGMPAWQQLAELLRKHYYCIQHTDDSDPDLPRYTLGLDTTAKKQAQLTSKVKQLTEQLAAAEAQLTANQQQSQQLLTELKTQHQNDQQQLEQQKAGLAKQLAAATQQASADKQQLEQQKSELSKQLELSKQQAQKLQQELEQIQKQAAHRLEKIADLDKANRQFAETNCQLNKRQKALEQEMLKAKAQIDIIKELLLKPE